MIGRKESVGLSLSELSLSMAFYGQSDKRNSDLGTQQIQVHRVAHGSPSGPASCSEKPSLVILLTCHLIIWLVLRRGDLWFIAKV